MYFSFHSLISQLVVQTFGQKINSSIYIERLFLFEKRSDLSSSDMRTNLTFTCESQSTRYHHYHAYKPVAHILRLKLSKFIGPYLTLSPLGMSHLRLSHVKVAQ